MGIAAAAVALWYFWDEPLFSPLSPGGKFKYLLGIRPPAKPPKIVYGYLPYWNLDTVSIQPELTHLAYFSLGIAADGTILTKTADGTEPGYSKLGSDKLMELTGQVAPSNRTFEIVLTQFNSDDIYAFINNPEAHQKLITSLDSVLLAYPVSGVNIDVEYVGEVTPELRAKFVMFITQLRQHLNTKYKGINLSVAVYASAAAKMQLWDIAALAPQIDYLVVMAYDFHRRSSPQAGPVAPLFGSDTHWDSDIHHYLKAFLAQIPGEKILLGVPFYGYGWQTVSTDAQANTYPDTGRTFTYEKILELLARKKELKLKERWQEDALSPWLTYVENDETYVVYYENPLSLAYKLEYVRELKLGGIAIWALGYEGGDRALWEVVKKGKI